MPKVRVLSRIRRLSRGSTGFFGGNRLSFTNKRPTGRHRSVRKVRSIQIFPVGLIQIFPGNRKGANSNVFGGKKAKPYLTVAPYKVRTSSGPKLPVWNGSNNLQHIHSLCFKDGQLWFVTTSQHFYYSKWLGTIDFEIHPPQNSKTASNTQSVSTEELSSPPPASDVALLPPPSASEPELQDQDSDGEDDCWIVDPFDPGVLGSNAQCHGCRELTVSKS